MENSKSVKNSSIEENFKPQALKHPYFRESLETLEAERLEIREKLEKAIDESQAIAHFRDISDIQNILSKKIENLKALLEIVAAQISLYKA